MKKQILGVLFAFLLTFQMMGCSNGKVENLFDGENLIYQGQIKNGKQDGQGKEYWFNYVQYDGQWKNGVYDGVGTLYIPDENHAVFIEGVWKEGYLVSGKMYDQEGNLCYEGGFAGSEKDQFTLDSHGEIYYDDGQVAFVGNFENSRPTGIGICYDHEGRVTYEGEWGIEENDGMEGDNHYLLNGKIYQYDYQTGTMITTWQIPLDEEAENVEKRTRSAADFLFLTLYCSPMEFYLARYSAIPEEYR